VSPSIGGEAPADRTAHTVTLTLEDFAWDTLEEEAQREGVTTEELITFSVLYYLADVDSQRISRQVSRSPYPRRAEDRTAIGADGANGA
jgi:hypothetical protein